MMLSPQAARMGAASRKIGLYTSIHSRVKVKLLCSSTSLSCRWVHPSSSASSLSLSGTARKLSTEQAYQEDDAADHPPQQEHITITPATNAYKNATPTTLTDSHRSRGHAAAAEVRRHSPVPVIPSDNNNNNITTNSKEPWRINLNREDDSWLHGPRPDYWFTGLSPSSSACPGVDVQTVHNPQIRSLPLPNLRQVTRANAREYFDNSWTLYETLFAGFKGEEGFYRPPVHGLRHSQIFYYGHTACLYVNKLRLSGVLSDPVNAYYESIFEVGVDEMLWDDMHKNDMLWPTVSEVHKYRQQVYDTVVQAILHHPSLDDIDGSTGVKVDSNHPMWALFMGFEHERIHLETSSVLFRETPLHLVQTPVNWPRMHPSAYYTSTTTGNHDDFRPTSNPIEGVHYPANRMIAVSSSSHDPHNNNNNNNKAATMMSVDLGKPADFPSYGWDNEYGERTVTVPPFSASQHMITNGEYYQFVKSGGYVNAKYWCDDGWAWRSHRNLKWPFFWEPAGPAGSHHYALRTIFEVIAMPWDWPVDVNYYEAKAYCRWKTAQDEESRPYRVLTEAEHHILRHKEHNLEAARRDANADKVMVTSGKEFSRGPTGANINLAFSSQNPVDYFAPSQTGHCDTTGSAWEWTEDHFNPLLGFEHHTYYDDFSTPCFDGKHSMIVGGSFISTGDEASVFARFHFRPHFLQHSGFRLVASDHEAPATHLFAHFEGQAAARDKAAVQQQSAHTANDNGSNDSVYETEDSLHMYLGLHYPSSGETENVPPILPHDNAPNHAVRFPQRVVHLLNSLLNQRVASTPSRALDIGCAVGGASFELAKTFDQVDAFDFSDSFVEAAKRMQTQQDVRFRIPVEADLFQEVMAVHEPDVTEHTLSKVNFFTGDACRLAEMRASGRLGAYDGVVMSNLLCRLPDPMACLIGLPAVVNKGGVALLVTPFSWLSEFTPRSKWLGGFYDDPVSKEHAIHSKDVLRRVMEENGFAKIHEEQMPLVIREHQRKYQYIISEATGWRKVE